MDLDRLFKEFSAVFDEMYRIGREPAWSGFQEAISHGCSVGDSLLYGVTKAMSAIGVPLWEQQTPCTSANRLMRSAQEIGEKIRPRDDESGFWRYFPAPWDEEAMRRYIGDAAYEELQERKRGRQALEAATREPQW